MADKIGGIFIDLGLNTAAFSSGLTKAQGQIKGFAASTKSTLGKLGGSAFSGLAAGALGAVAPILGLSAAINTMQRGLKEFGDISDAAKASGLDAEYFQGVAHAASLSGVSFEQLAGSLAAFNRGAGQAESGTGRMAAQLAKLNPELLRNIQNAKTQEERVRLAADAINAAGSASQKAALSVALFGESGTKLVDAFNGGAAAIDAAVASAKAMGLVVDRELIASADELGDQFETASKILDLQFKQALVGLAPILIGTADLVGGVVMAVRGLIEQFSALDSRSTSSLEGRLAQIKELQATIGSDVVQPDGQIVPANPMAVSIGGADPVKLDEERKQLEAILTLRKALEVPTVDAGAGGLPYNDVAQQRIDKAKEVLAGLQFEAEQLGRTAEQQAVYNALKAAGVTAESSMGLQIAAATTELERQRAALEANAALMESIRGTASDLLGGFVSDLRDGKSAVDALGNAFDRLSDKLLDMALDAAIMGTLNALFPGAGTAAGAAKGLIPGLGGFASGTANTGGVRGQARGIVHGQEAVIPLPSGGKVPVDVRVPTAMVGNQGAGGTIVISLSDGLEGRILAAAGQQTIKIVDQRTPAIVKAVAPGAVGVANRNRTG